MATDPGNGRGLILVLESDPTLATLLVEILGDEGYRVLAAADAEAGLVLATALRPSLAILDHVLRGVDGLGLARRLRTDPHTCDLPLLLCSAEDGALRDAAVELQQLEVPTLAKPFELGQLLGAVERLARASAPACHSSAGTSAARASLLRSRSVSTDLQRV